MLMLFLQMCVLVHSITLIRLYLKNQMSGFLGNLYLKQHGMRMLQTDYQIP